MKQTTYFIKHPIIACILNLMLCLLGYLSFDSIQVREYPEVSFPKVQIFTHYHNASPMVVEDTITNPLEDKLAGLAGLDTITSESMHGLSYIDLNFKHGTAIDQALLNIREAINLVSLPDGVKAPIIERTVNTNNLPFMLLSLNSADATSDFAALTHYANLNLKNTFRSIPGVAEAAIWGQPYTLTIKLDMRKLYAFGINVDEITSALRHANVALPAGKFRNEISVTVNAELKTVADYENLVIREKQHDHHNTLPAIRLKQIASVTLAADTSTFRVRINGNPGLCIAIKKTNDANPLASGAVAHHCETVSTSVTRIAKT
jgi:multidrug efflux pump